MRPKRDTLPPLEFATDTRCALVEMLLWPDGLGKLRGMTRPLFILGEPP